MPKCEFCDIALNRDLDVAKHLVSQTHRDNVTKATTLRPLEKSSLKDTPSNIVKVFESLKLRTVKDVRDLADKGYFRIPENSPSILGVADRLARVFIRCIADHKTRNLQPNIKKIIMDSLIEVKEKPKEETKPTLPLVDTRTPNRQSNKTFQPLPTQKQPQPAASSYSRQEPTISRSPPPKRRPAAYPKPSPLCVTTSQARPAVISATTITQPLGPRPNQPLSSASGQPVHQQTRSGQIPTPRAQAPPRAPRNNPTSASNVRPMSASTGQLRSVGPRADLTNNGPRPSQNGPRPNAPRSNVGIPPPSQMPMMGAAFMHRPLDSGEPAPRKDSTYRPLLARIKVEPRDDN